MTQSWDIDPAATQGVLRKTAANIDDQNESAKKLGNAIDDAAMVLGPGLVAKALGDYVDASLVPNLTSAAGRSNRIVEGAHDALVAYVRADFLMAQQSQASALAAGAVDNDGGPGATGGSADDGGWSPPSGAPRTPARG